MMRMMIALGVVLAVGAGCGSTADDGGGEYGARDVCEQFVKDRLKSPGSAKFSETKAVETTTGEWTVEGAVDSENSFGALIRNSYVCKVRHTSGENWRLVNLESSER